MPIIRNSNLYYAINYLRHCRDVKDIDLFATSVAAEIISNYGNKTGFKSIAKALTGVERKADVIAALEGVQVYPEKPLNREEFILSSIRGLTRLDIDILYAINHVASSIFSSWGLIEDNRGIPIILNDLLGRVYKQKDVDSRLKPNAALVSNRLVDIGAAFHRPYIYRGNRSGPYTVVEYINDAVSIDTWAQPLFNEKFATIEDWKEQASGEKVYPKLGAHDLRHLKREYEIAINHLKQCIKANKGCNILLWGPPGTGKTQLAAYIASQVGINLYNLSVNGTDSGGTLGSIRQDNCGSLERGRHIKFLAKQQFKGIFLVDEAEDVLASNIGGTKHVSKSPRHTILETTLPIIWTTNRIDMLEASLVRRMDVIFEIDIPPSEVRAERLQVMSEGIIPPHVAEDLAVKYATPFSAYEKALSVAKSNKTDKEGVIDRMLKETCQSLAIPVSNEANLSKHFNLNLINCSEDVTVLVEKLVKSRCKWSLCLHGEPGTGKTEYARYIVSRLGKTPHVKRASDVFGPYVGQTEGNIASMFEEAEGGVLILDEIDSLLRSREMANKTWEVSSVNEFLSQMDKFKDPVICTTNNLRSMDEASLRRFTFKIKLDPMSQDQLKTAYIQFFGKSPNRRIPEGLTLGDFAVVKNKVDILGDMPAEKIISMLEEELALKYKPLNKIGF